MTSGIAELAHREQRDVGKRGYNVSVAGGKWEVRQIKFGLVRRVHHSAIGVSDSNGIGGWSFVDDMCRDSTKV